VSRLSPLLGLQVILVAACLQSPPMGSEALVPGLALRGTLAKERVLQSDVERDGIRRVIWESSIDRLEIRVTPVVGELAARRLVSDREHLLSAVFEQPYSTYKLGPMSKRRCPDGLRPVPVDLQHDALRGHAYLLAATEDYVFGGCSSESAELVAAYVNVWCPGAVEVFELRYYAARSQGRGYRQRFLDSLACE
jgi:hypothetical protein